MLCFPKEENENFILIIFPLLSLSPFLFVLIPMHGQYHILAVQEILANNVAISSRILDILHLLCGSPSIHFHVIAECVESVSHHCSS